MKEFSAFVLKEFRHIFRDRRTTLIVLVMPVVQIVLFGFAISTDVHNAVVDRRQYFSVVRQHGNTEFFYFLIVNYDRLARQICTCHNKR